MFIFITHNTRILFQKANLYKSIRFFHQSHNTVHFGGLFTLKQWIFSSLKHDPVPRENKLYCFYVKNPPKRIALWDRENSQYALFSHVKKSLYSQSELRTAISHVEV